MVTQTDGVEIVFVTDAEYRLYTFALVHVCRYGRPPTHREIADYLGVNKSRVCRLVAQLEEKGVIDRSGGGNQGLMFSRLVFRPLGRQVVQIKTKRADTSTRDRRRR